MRNRIAAALATGALVAIAGCGEKRSASVSDSPWAVSQSAPAPTTVRVAQAPPPARRPAPVAAMPPTTPYPPAVREAIVQTAPTIPQRTPSAAPTHTAPEPQPDLELPPVVSNPRPARAQSRAPVSPPADAPEGDDWDQANSELAEIAAKEKDDRPEAPRPLAAGASYIVREGDELDVVYRESWSAGTDYRLLPGDRIRVELMTADPSSSLDRTMPLQPDGKIALPYAGEVQASGFTVSELAVKLRERYRELYVDPQILVTLESTGEGLRNLRSSLETAGNRTTLVGPDGLIVVPYLDPVPAAGLSLGEIQDEINERYHRAMPGVAVTVRLAGRR